MRKLVILAVLFLASQVFAVPKMVIPNDSFDFGFIPQDSKVSHVFWIKSVGDDSLKVLKVVPG